MAFCYQCGKPISEQSKFCPYCGYHLEQKKVVPAAEPTPEPEPVPKGKTKKGKEPKGKDKKKEKKGKSEELEVFEVEEDFTGKAPESVAYTVDRQPTPPVQPEPVQRTPDNPMPSRDQTNVPTIAESAHPADEDKFGWVWIVVGVIILLIVLIVVWALLFSGYY